MALLRHLLIIVVLVAAFCLLDRFMHWMNQPSNLLLYSGLLGLLCVMAGVPILLRIIWKMGR